MSEQCSQANIKLIQRSGEEVQEDKKPLKGFQRSMKVKLYQNRFINYLRKRQTLYRSLSTFHHQIIRDNSRKETYLENQTKQPENFWGKINKSWFARWQRKMSRKFSNLSKSACCQFIINIIHLLPVINPNNIFKSIWDVCLAFIRFYLLIVIPLEISFNNKLLYNQLAESVIFCITLLGLDILLNFQTSYYEKGYLIKNHSRIASNYIKSGFFFDFFCILSLIIVFAQELNESNRYIEWQQQHLRVFENSRDFISLFGIILQLQNIYRVFQRLQNSQDFSQTITLLIDLLKLVMFLFLLEHVFSCVWYFVGVRIEGNTWLTEMKLQQSTYTEQYITAFYFASVTMFTVGYGDVVPHNQYERLVTITFMILSTLQLSYTISAIWNVYSKLNEKSEEHIRKMRAINGYMKYMNISTQLRYKIREYLTFFWKEQAVEEDMEVRDIVAQLSPDLQESLIFEANSIIVEGCQLFRENFSHEFKGEVLKLVQTTTLIPGKVLSFDEPSLYFIERGTIGVRHPVHKLELFEIKKGDNFGLREFILGDMPICQFYSKGFSKLIFVTQRQFLDLLQQFPEDLEQYCAIRDRVIFENSNYGSFCYSCQSLQHQITKCPQINLRVDRYFVIKKASYPQQQQRTSKYQRNKFKKRAVLLKDIQIETNRQNSIPSLESEESCEFNLRESLQMGHNQYFKKGKDFSAQISKKDNQQSITDIYVQQKLNRNPIEIDQMDSYDDEELNDKDQDQMQQLKMRINQRQNLNIDSIANFKYYNPDFNFSLVFKNQKMTQRLQDSWNSICYYLTYPYEFLKKYRSHVYRELQNLGSSNKQIFRPEDSQKKRKTVIMFKPQVIVR